jgi:hypothetical protein
MKPEGSLMCSLKFAITAYLKSVESSSDPITSFSKADFKINLPLINSLKRSLLCVLSCPPCVQSITTSYFSIILLILGEE